MAVMKNICRVWLLLSLFGFSLVVMMKKGGKSSWSSSSSCYVKNKDFFNTVIVTGYSGGSVVLPCHCEDLQTRPRNLFWKRGDTVVCNITEGYSEPDMHEDYEGRVALVDNGTPGDLSLIINDLREEDAGTYDCRTENSGDSTDLVVIGCDQTMPGERVEISKLAGESVLLPCWCLEKAKPKKFTWRGPNGRLIRSYTEKSGHFSLRMEMFNEAAMWNVSLLLSDLTDDDEGEYTCEINDVDKKVIISLTITRCTLLDQDEVVEVEATPGSSILLPCACANLMTKPRGFHWKMPNSREIHWHYKGRAQLFHQTSSPGNLSLLLSDLTSEDQGVYRCEVAEGKSKVFVLTVNEPTHAKLEGDGREVTILESPCRLQHLLLFMLAILILLLITHMTVGAMIIRWKNQGAAPGPCVQYSN